MGEKRARTALWAVLLIVAVFVTACGSDDSDEGSASGTPESATAAATAPAKAAAPAGDIAGIPTMEELFKGYESAPPTDGPPVAKSKNVWWVSCGQSVGTCANPPAAAQEAAKKLGWEFHIADGQLNQNGGNLKAIQTAVAAKPDAIIVHGIACEGIRAPLEDAKAKGIPVMGLESTDCNDPLSPDPGTSLYSAEMKYSTAKPTVADYFESQGLIGGSYLIRASEGKAKVIELKQTIPTLALHTAKGFAEAFSHCEGCEILDQVEYSTADSTPNGPLVQRFRASLVKNPTVEQVFSPTDTPIVALGVPQDTEAARGKGKVTIAGGSGASPAVFDLVRAGSVAEVTSHDGRWMAYGAMDNLNRLFNDQDTVPQGVGNVAVTKDQNLPAKGKAYESSIDWMSAYTKLWSTQ